MHGMPKYEKNFAHLSYVNQDAPNGGTLRFGSYGSFDNLNRVAFKGSKAAGLGYINDTLMRRVWDEAFSLYGLIAEYVDMPEDRSSITFFINPKARFHDGSPITRDDVLFSLETFQTKEDHNFLEGFREKKIPLLIRKALGTEYDFIVPWLRENTAELNDYQSTIKIMKRGVRVTEDQFGWLKKEVDVCAEILGLEKVPHVFVVGDTSMTANVVNFHDPMILLSSDLIEKSNVIALRFAIGQQKLSLIHI